MIQSFATFLARAFISLGFIFSGIYKLLDWSGSESFLHDILTHYSLVSMSPLLIGWLSGAIDWALTHTTAVLFGVLVCELVGGIMVFLGLIPRLGALLLLCVAVPALLILHPFWEIAEPQKAIERMHFMHGLSIIGGLLFVLARGNCESPRCSSSDIKDE